MLQRLGKILDYRNLLDARFHKNFNSNTKTNIVSRFITSASSSIFSFDINIYRGFETIYKHYGGTVVCDAHK